MVPAVASVVGPGPPGHSFQRLFSSGPRGLDSENFVVHSRSSITTECSTIAITFPATLWLPRINVLAWIFLHLLFWERSARENAWYLMKISQPKSALHENKCDL